MKGKVANILKDILGADVLFELSVPEVAQFGHFSTNVAMRLAKERGKKPFDLATELAAQISAKAPAGFFEKIEAAMPGFINLWISADALRKELQDVIENNSYGHNASLAGKTVMVEFTDPNPFKLFHIGHLMSNTIGESFARLFEASGAKVIRANYQGDVGLHVAKAIWGMKQVPEETGDLNQRMNYLGKAYAAGATAYDANPSAKEEITYINEKIYARSDAEINEAYDKGRTWSLEYFETIYKRLGTTFDQYFFEGEMGKDGVELVRSRPDIFIESQGAVIFPGEQYGLHTRVFINAHGLPTYEAKELGLNKKKFELYPLDASVIVTGNEIVDYFKVLLKAMELTLPQVAAKTHHVPHGMLRLPSGKMSSRTGDVITAESLLAEVHDKLGERANERVELSASEREEATEAIAIGAIKYSILKQNPGQDIIFDFEKSLSVEGDSGPYLQYAYARLRSILRKGDAAGRGTYDVNLLDSDVDFALMRKIFEFPDVVSRALTDYAPSTLATYLYKLSGVINKFYETTPIMKDENAARRDARLALIEVAANVLRTGLGLLGMKTLEKI